MSGNRPLLARRGLRLVVLIAAGICLLAVAAGAFAFSYLGVRDMALAAGVTPRVARFYPLLFDAVLIVACAAAVTLRGAMRGYAWLAILVIIGAVATADTAHAMSITVPTRPLEAAIAIAPWVVLLGGLSLLDAMFRQRAPGRPRESAAPLLANGRAPSAALQEPAASPPAGASVVPLNALLHDRSTAPASRAQAPVGQPAAGPGRPQAIATPSMATTGPPKTAVSPPATGPGQSHANNGPPQATTSPPKAGPGPPDADPAQSEATTSPPKATNDPSQGTTSPPAADPAQSQATTKPPKATTIPSQADPGQSQATADPPKATNDPVADGPEQPAAAGSPGTVSQIPPESGEGRSRAS